MKVFVIFNTCGISGREFIQQYVNSINQFRNQEFDSYRVCLSSCRNSNNILKMLYGIFENSISYNLFQDILPVNITFNRSVKTMVENFGEADAYLYVDSGIDLMNQKDILKKMYELHTSEQYGMTAARVSSDSGYHLWFGIGKSPEDESEQDKLFKNGHFIIPVGKTVNLHLQLFDNSIFQNFDKRIMPDIFASHSTEGVFTFVNSCLGKRFVIHKDVFVRHFTSMDGGSSGFRPEYAGVPGWQHTLPFSPRKIVDIIHDEEAKECGFGYEECQNILMHNDEKFDKNGTATDKDKLRKFLLNNFYLPMTHFNYDSIKYQFIK